MIKRKKEKKALLLRTIYGRLLLSYIAVITITIIVLIVIMVRIISNQYTNEMKNELVRECNNINSIMPMWMDEEQREKVRMELAVIARQYNAQIWIIDLQKEVYIQPGDNWLISEERIVNNPALDAIFNGEEILTMNLSEDSIRGNVMTIGRPFVKSGKIQGAILMSKRTIDVVRNTKLISQSLIIPTCLAIVLTVLLVSIILRRFTSPLASMNQIAKSYAKGYFKERVAVTSADEIGQLAVSFNAMASDLQSLEDMRRSFVANVSHELKSPLASMWGFLQAMLDGSIPEREHQEYMELVLDETRRLSALIDDLLNLSTMESGDIPMKPLSFDINELVVRTLFTFEQRIDEKEVNVDLRFAQESTLVWADRERITQVIRNLVDNALKYLDKGGTLSVVSKLHIKGNMVYIALQDTGAGIPPEDVKHIFERFYKVDKAHTPRKEGTGLGLSIVKRIIEQHGGTVEVESVLGEGTTFIFSLPLYQADAKKRQSIGNIKEK